MAGFWNTVQCGLVELDRRRQYAPLKRRSTSRLHGEEDYHLHTRRRENLQSHIQVTFICSLFYDAVSVTKTIQRRMMGVDK
jgi:hypothetical protein